MHLRDAGLDLQFRTSAHAMSSKRHVVVTLAAQLTGAVEPGESLLQRLVRLDAILVKRPRPPPHEDDDTEARHAVRLGSLILTRNLA